jgi:hypothetical protein
VIIFRERSKCEMDSLRLRKFCSLDARTLRPPTIVRLRVNLPWTKVARLVRSNRQSLIARVKASTLRPGREDGTIVYDCVQR